MSSCETTPIENLLSIPEHALKVILGMRIRTVEQFVSRIDSEGKAFTDLLGVFDSTLKLIIAGAKQIGIDAHDLRNKREKFAAEHPGGVLRTP